MQVPFQHFARPQRHSPDDAWGFASGERTALFTPVDGLRSYNIISRQMILSVEHRRSKYLNNSAENSHQPTRRRERRMQRFKSPQQAQQFLSVFDILYHYFHPKKHKLKADLYRDQLDERYDTWSQLIA